MGLLDTLLGRTKPAKPDLDQLFALPSAAIGLQAAADLMPTGTGSVCVKPAEGGGFAGLRHEVEQLLATGPAGSGGQAFGETTDDFGFTWLTRTTTADDVPGLVSDLHGVNTTLEAAGFGGALLCTLVSFTDGQAPPIGLVYLYKRGTWYPFAPTGPQRRDSARELQIRAVLGEDLRVEPDLSRWFPVWGAPGL